MIVFVIVVLFCFALFSAHTYMAQQPFEEHDFTFANTAGENTLCLLKKSFFHTPKLQNRFNVKLYEPLSLNKSASCFAPKRETIPSPSEAYDLDYCDNATNYF